MFGIGMTELVIILIIALLVIGPEKIPELARTIGKGLAEFKKTAEDFRNTIHENLEVEEEKEKLLQKSQESKKSKPEKEEDLTKEEHEKTTETEIEDGPIADQAPFLKSETEDKSDNHN